MAVTDPALPAYEFLIGRQAIELLGVPIGAGGGEVLSARVVHVQYRPGSDVVVRYSAQVSWNGADPVRETLVAASAVHRTYPGAVALVADTHRGRAEVGVWRYPFDPMLPGLADVVTPQGAAAALDRPPADMSVRIVAYLPTERAVVRVDVAGDPVAYLKVVAPRRVASIQARHAALLAGGIPAAPVVVAHETQGVLGLRALVGPTLRELTKTDAPGWPPASEFGSLLDRLAAVELDASVGRGPASRLADGPGHARMLATVAPRFGPRLEELADRFESSGPSPVDGVVHGDLHEAQVIVDDERIVGLLDVDDVGPGATLDDWANLIARLAYRSVTTPQRRQRIDAYSTEINAIAATRHDPHRLDLHVAAALVGLATGPFRIRAAGWEQTVDDVLVRAEAAATRGERR